MSREGLAIPGSRPDMQRVFNRHAMPSLTTGGQTSLELPRGHALKRMFLDLRLDVTLAGGGTILSDSPLSLLRALRVSATRRGGGGRVTWKSGPAYLFYMAAAFKKGRFPYLVQFLNGNAQVNTILRATVPIDFYASNFGDQGRGLLYTTLFEDLRLDLTWGVPADIVSSGATINSATCDVITHEIPGLLPDPGEPTYNNIEESAMFPVNQSADRAEMFDLGLSGELKSLLFRTANSSAAGRPLTNSIIENIEVNTNGMFMNRKYDWEQLRALNAWENGPGVHPIMTDAAGTRALNLGSQWQPRDGYGFIDFAQNGGEDGLIQASALDSFKVFGKVVTNGNAPQVEMLVNRFEPLQL